MVSHEKYGWLVRMENVHYVAPVPANGTFTDLDQAMYIAPNTDQVSPAPLVIGWSIIR